MANSYSSVVSAGNGSLSGFAMSAGAPITYELTVGGFRASLYGNGDKTLSGLTAAQLSQIRVRDGGTNVNGTPVSLLEVAGQTITVPADEVKSILAVIPQAVTEVNRNISNQVKTAAPAPAPAPAPTTTSKPATTTPPAPPVITNSVPNPKLTTNTPVPPIVTPIVTKTVAKPTVTAAPTTTVPALTPVPNPKLTTNTPVPPIVTVTPIVKAVVPAPLVPVKTNAVTPVTTITAGSPALIPAPRVLAATITNPLAPPAPAYQLAISNPVPNPVLKPPTQDTINSLITPTPTIKATQPALIPAPTVVAPTVTNPFSKPVPDPNAIVNAVPNPKLNTKVPPGNYVAVTTTPTITAGTPALVAAPITDQLIVTPTITSGTPKIIASEPVPGDTIINEIPNPDFSDSATGLSQAQEETAVSATQQDQANFAAREDWRVRLALAPGTSYMYNASDPGILQPLIATDGVVFPYTPTIAVNYSASYESLSPVHSNYKINQYTNSSVDSVSLTCDFTAQDAFEARYLLAVIHFFRSMTKMFYGQDTLPKNGTPPPLCYLFGLGEFQFSALPLAITSFNYTLPTDVDYIKTTAASPAGSPQEAISDSANTPSRLGSMIGKGGMAPGPSYGATSSSAGAGPTYVPTRIQLSITCLPMMSRNSVSNDFSLRDYANGELLKGTVRPNGGMW